jgi:hypothetical protein
VLRRAMAFCRSWKARLPKKMRLPLCCLAGEGVHGPADAYADGQEKEERPHDVSGALVGTTAAEKTEGYGYHQREDHHGLQMAEAEFWRGSHALRPRVAS